jgi:hypothetical protein
MLPGTAPILVSPYTLLDEEALGWSLLFSDRVLFLHPYPLDLPETCRHLMDRGLLQVHTLPRTPEEIREKDRKIREFQAFVSQNPDFSFLEYLRQSHHEEPLETRDEILAHLRGGAPKTDRVRESPGEPAGDILLCLIHDWISQQWEIDRSLDRLADQEKALAGIMEAGFEFSGDWSAPGSSFVASADPELYCPPALLAWKSLKEQLAPKASVMVTTQKWVWQDRYRLDPDDPSVPSLPLPGWADASVESFQQDIHSWTSAGSLQPVRQMFGELALGSPPDGQKVKGLQTALEAFALSGPGRYRLVLPPLPSPETEVKEALFLLRPDRGQ